MGRWTDAAGLLGSLVMVLAAPLQPGLAAPVGGPGYRSNGGRGLAALGEEAAPAPGACESLPDCTSCFRRPGCGWCGASRQCMAVAGGDNGAGPAGCARGWSETVCYASCSGEATLHDAAGMVAVGSPAPHLVYYLPGETCTYTIAPLPHGGRSDGSGGGGGGGGAAVVGSRSRASMVRLQFEYVDLGPGDTLDIFSDGVGGSKLLTVTGRGAGIVDRIISSSRSGSVAVRLTARADGKGGTGFRLFYRNVEASQWDVYLISAVVVAAVLTCVLCSCCCNNCIAMLAGHPVGGGGGGRGGMLTAGWGAATATNASPFGNARALTAEEKARLPVSAYDAGDLRYEDCRDCCICLTSFEASESVRSLPCGHIYHPGCIDCWLDINSTCPLCKQDARDKLETSMSGLPEDAIARAKAIAAKLNASLASTGAASGGGGGGGGGDGGGDKKRRWGEANDDGLPKQKKKIYIPMDNPEFNFISLLIGPRGTTQKRLQDQTGARINIRGKGSEKGGPPSNNPDDDDELHVVIEGTEDQVEAATKEVENILFNPVEAMRLKQQQLRNLAEMRGGIAISGPGGEVSRGAKPGLGFDGHYGPSGGGGGAGGEDYVTEEMQIPNTMVGLIIGKGGENIQRMTAQTGCFVQVAKEIDMQPGETNRNVTLKGPKEGVAECRKIIQDIMDSKQRGGPGGPRSSLGSGGGGDVPDGSTYGMVHSLTLQVPSDKVGLIIGRGGSTIKSIQERTGAHVQIPQPGPGEDPSTRTVNISASSLDQAQHAEAEIQGLISGDRPRGGPHHGGPPGGGHYGGPPQQALIMHVQNDKIGLIIGRGGAHIKEVQMRTGTRIQIPPNSDPPDCPYRVVTILGSPEGQERARYDIETKIMNEGCRDAMGNYIPYQPSPAFLVPHGGPGAGGPPGLPPPQGAPSPGGGGGSSYYGQPQQQQAPPTGGAYGAYGAPPGYHQAPPQQQDPYAAYYGYQQQAPPPPGGDPSQPPAPSPTPGQTAAGAPQGSPANGHAPAPSANGGGGGDAASAAASGVDLTQYHEQFWQYAAHYGEGYARQKYGVWSPPEGTPCPANITLPTPEAAAAAIARAEAEKTA